MKKKFLHICMLFLVLGVCIGSAKTVDAATKTYKIVYHYSKSNQSKKVTKTVRVGKYVKLQSVAGLKFTSSSSSVFVGWNVRQKKNGKWMLYKGSGSKWGTYNSTNAYVVTSGTTWKTGTTAGNEIHFYGKWEKASNIPVTRKYFNSNGYVASGSDKKDDTKAIQNALNLANKTSKTITITIPKGTYYISSPLHVYSNTNLVLTSQTKIVANPKIHKAGTSLYVGQSGSNRSGGYAQAKNITISGGIWDGDFGKKGDSGVMRFNHCKNIVVKNLVIQNYTGKHAILFAGVYNGTIQNCTFQNHITTIPGTTMYGASVKSFETAEAIHTDTTSLAGESVAVPIDNTVCNKILIKGCTFKNVYAGIGHHTLSPTNRSSSYQVIGNDFQSVKYYCLDIFFRDNVIIQGNKAHMEDESYFLRAYESTFKINQAPILY